MADHSYPVNPSLNLNFMLLKKQIEIMQEFRNKARGKRRDLLHGVIALLMDIQEQAVDEHDEEIVYGAFECSSCWVRTNEGHAHHGSFYCEECWACAKVTE